MVEEGRILCRRRDGMAERGKREVGEGGKTGQW